MIVGSICLAARRFRITSNPSRRGSITSSTIRSIPPDKSHRQGLFAIECQLHGIPFALKSPLQEARHARLVLGHQHSHVKILSRCR